jgi:hypothetical protein
VIIHSSLSFTVLLQHAFFIGFTVGKTLKKRHPKMVTDPCISLATNPVNLRILLQSTTNDMSLDASLSIGKSSVEFHYKNQETNIPG